MVPNMVKITFIMTLFDFEAVKTEHYC